MCKAIDDMITDARNDGLTKGRDEATMKECLMSSLP